MKSITPWLITLSLLLIGFNAVAQPAVAEQFKIVDSLLTSEYAGGPGLVVLATRDGETVFQRGYGLAHLETGLALSPDMIFEIGSMTKQFTSAAVLQLVERGEVKLDDPIQQYVPYFPVKEHPITLHHLLSQTSGIPEFFDVDEEEFHLLSQEHTPEQLIGYYKDLPLNFVPGTRFEYSNSNYPLLGVVVEQVSGLPLADYFRRYLFDPLDMTQTSLWYRDEHMGTSNVPQGYRRDAAGRLVTSPAIDGSTVYAAGGIVSTLADLAKWQRELADPQVLSRKTARMLTRENKTTDNGKTGYGYGFFIEDFKGRRVVQHGGNMYGFTSTAMYLPKEDVYVCVLSNVAFANTKNVARYLCGVLLEDRIPYFRQLDPRETEEYVGKYELANATIQKTVEIKHYEGQLLLHFPEDPQSDVVLYGTGEDRFASTQIDLTLQFTRGERGVVVGFLARQGEVYEFVRNKDG